MSKVDLSGDEPKYVWSVNLRGVQFYVVLLLACITLGTAVWGGVSVSAEWMRSTTDRHINDNIEEAVRPPDGVIYRATEDQIKDGLEDLEKNIESIQRQMIQQDYMLSEVFQTVTGRQPPPKVE